MHMLGGAGVESPSIYDKEDQVGHVEAPSESVGGQGSNSQFCTHAVKGGLQDPRAHQRPPPGWNSHTLPTEGV